MQNVLMAEMNAGDYKKALAETDTVIVPLGSTEILGTHSPLGTDHIMAAELSRRLGEMADCVVAPTIPIGEAGSLSHWAGTLTTRSEVLEALYGDICAGLVSHGFKRVFFFNNHLGNIPAAAAVCQDLRRQGILAAQVDWWRVAFSAGQELSEADVLPNGHGGELTTSVIMALRPELVDLEQATPEDGKPPFTFYGKYAPQAVFTYFDCSDYCDSGGWGDPALATKEKGEEIISRGLAFLETFLNDFKAQPLPAPL